MSAPRAPPRARPCSTPCATSRRCTPICSSCATTRPGRPTRSPRTRLPTALETRGVWSYPDMGEGLDDADVIVMLRLQRERMRGALIPSEQEYFNLYGLTPGKLECAKPDAIVMHPGPMNRGLSL